MAKAKFHSLRGEKSALILVKKSDFQFSASPVYVPRAAVISACNVETEDDLEKDMTFNIPDSYRLEDIVDSESGEIRTATDGSHLKQLVFD